MAYSSLKQRSLNLGELLVCTLLFILLSTIAIDVSADELPLKHLTLNNGLNNNRSISNNGLDNNWLSNKWREISTSPTFFTFHHGFASDAQFHDSILFLEFERSTEHNFVSSISVGKKVADYFLVWPFDVIAYASIQRFDEREMQPDAWGGTLSAKVIAEFEVPYAGLPVRMGWSNGLSYVSRIPRSEVRDFLPDHSEKLIYYMDYSLQTSLSYLIGRGHKSLSPNIEDIYVGYGIWHRSTVFGLLGDTTGGINFLGLNLEAVLR